MFRSMRNWDFFDVVVGTLVFSVVVPLSFGFLAATFFVLHEMTGLPCKYRGELYGLATKHSVATGCWVKMENMYVPLSSLVVLEKDGKIVLKPASVNRFEVKTETK